MANVILLATSLSPSIFSLAMERLNSAFGKFIRWGFDSFEGNRQRHHWRSPRSWIRKYCCPGIRDYAGPTQSYGNGIRQWIYQLEGMDSVMTQLVITKLGLTVVEVSEVIHHVSSGSRY